MDEWPSAVARVVIDRDFWKGRRVLVTGHTGFKGAWASLLLGSLGADVHGFSLAPDSDDGVFQAARVAGDVHHTIGDIRDLNALRRAVEIARPEIVIHMAAQALVRPSYADPVGTYATNVMGTVHLLELLRHSSGLQAIVVVTSDKCYDNKTWVWGYRETDPMGGHDPYSNSKGCAELVADSFRRSYFSGPSAARLGSGRAGNVIGGGDWALDRLVPDAIRAFRASKPLLIRNPNAVRPWQHVIDPVVAYLQLAERLVKDGQSVAEGWNFGPSAESEVPVAQIVNGLVGLWGGAAHWQQDGGEHPHEAAYLKLDCSKAQTRLGWRPLLDLEEALRLTVEWYRAFGSGADMRAVTLAQIERILSAGSDRHH